MYIHKRVCSICNRNTNIMLNRCQTKTTRFVLFQEYVFPCLDIESWWRCYIPGVKTKKKFFFKDLLRLIIVEGKFAGSWYQNGILPAKPFASFYPRFSCIYTAKNTVLPEMTSFYVSKALIWSRNVIFHKQFPTKKGWLHGV